MTVRPEASQPLAADARTLDHPGAEPQPPAGHAPASGDMAANLQEARPGPAVERLVEIMARLRHPETGCPWDAAQSFETIVPYTIEEAYEVADAVERRHWPDLRDELGDLLLQVAFHARMAEEIGLFAFTDVADAISDKLVRRHPHVFGDDARPWTADEQVTAWEALKRAERQQTTDGGPDEESVLDGITNALPALLRAVKLQKRAATVGFDWPDASAALPKVSEEVGELAAEIAAGAAAERLEDEMGDLLFAAVNVARKLGIDPETALRRANGKFEDRFRRMETLFRQESPGRTLDEAGLDALEALWQRIKTGS